MNAMGMIKDMNTIIDEINGLSPGLWARMMKICEKAHLYTTAELEEITEWASGATVQEIKDRRVKEWEAFSAVWPYPFVLMHSGVFWEHRSVDEPRDTGPFGALDGLEEWLLAECGERGIDWDERGGFIGIKDPDAAFWFRVRWQ